LRPYNRLRVPQPFGRYGGNVNNWVFREIEQYWDQRIEAIHQQSRVLKRTPENEREKELDAIYSAVQAHAEQLSNEVISRFAVNMVDNLYKAPNQMEEVDWYHFAYLNASAGAFFDNLAQRGYLVNYFTNNTFSHLARPIQMFPMWFKAARIGYICPQHLAVAMFDENARPEQWPALIEKNMATAREVSAGLADQCLKDGRSFVFLDIDGQDFSVAEKSLEQPGVIWIFREDAPMPGTRVKMHFPAGPRAS
jgi:hypothetical protein